MNHSAIEVSSMRLSAKLIQSDSLHTMTMMMWTLRRFLVKLDRSGSCNGNIDPSLALTSKLLRAYESLPSDDHSLYKQTIELIQMQT